MPEPDDTDTYRVDPADHRGHNAGLLSLGFKLARHRRDDDIRGPRPLPVEPYREEER